MLLTSSSCLLWWYSLGIVGDETHDISNREQLNISMRSLDRKIVTYEDLFGITVGMELVINGNTAVVNN